MKALLQITHPKSVLRAPVLCWLESMQEVGYAPGWELLGYITRVADPTDHTDRALDILNEAGWVYPQALDMSPAQTLAARCGQGMWRDKESHFGWIKGPRWADAEQWIKEVMGDE